MGTRSDTPYPPRVYIMRGLPGSGREEAAENLAQNLRAEGMDVVVISAKDFFVGRPYSPREKSASHMDCLKRFTELLQAGKSVVVVNTNALKQDYEAYVAVANAFHAPVMIREIGCPDRKTMEKFARRDTMGYRYEVVRSMYERWEHDDRSSEYHYSDPADANVPDDYVDIADLQPLDDTYNGAFKIKEGM